MGKVHGSLARAGKVKSATPKVSIRSSLFFFFCVCASLSSCLVCVEGEMRFVRLFTISQKKKKKKKARCADARKRKEIKQ